MELNDILNILSSANQVPAEYDRYNEDEEQVIANLVDEAQHA